MLCRDKTLGYWRDKPTTRIRQYSFHYFPSLDEIFETTSDGYKQKFAINVGSRLYKVNHASVQNIDFLANNCIHIYKIKNKFHVHLSHSIPKYQNLIPKRLDEHIFKNPNRYKN